MRAKTLAASIFVATLIFSGCSKKSVEIETPQQPQSSTVSEVQEGAGIQTVGTMESELTEDQLLQLAKSIEAKAKKIYFDFDKYNIRPDQEPRVDYDAKLFNEPDAKRFTIRVEGNCDEWGTDEYNYALGLKRAKTVRDALAARGVEPQRMTIISYGESNPVCTEHTPECWALNRRVEFTLLP